MPQEHQATIFEAARELSPGPVRETYLEEACGDDYPLRQKIEGMLAALDQAEAFFDTENQETHSSIHPLTEGPGTHIGRYKLLQQIGEGGFGVVYMAEQKEPVIRKVALKIIKPGMDTKQVVARFESERQALALMDHPNIAKVLDGGATESGRPYFVMELVSGIPITLYCDEHCYSTRQRLNLFQEVCSAIQHAHQKGIIHRDIKPSNILVTLHGDSAVPKVIDFGIAKATHQRLTDKTLFTQFQQFIGTPAYMSPEQASLSGLDIDTRSDVYSLGVLLYELLVGQPPFDAKTLLSKGYDEIRRIIREDEAPRPSTRLKTLGDDERTKAAKQRKADPKRLSLLLRGDLDWIVMRALEKDRTHRYETANSLKEDVERYLQEEAVVAAAPTILYKLRKFVRRNRSTLTTGAAFVIFLLSATALSIWQALRTQSANEELAIQLILTSEAKTNAERSQIAAAEKAKEAKETLELLWLERGREAASEELPNTALAWFTKAYRSNPTNELIADNLVSALLQTSLPRPLTPILSHKPYIRHLEYSPTGNRLLTVSDNHTIRIWNTSTGQQIGKSLSHDDTIQHATFSPDGTSILTASRDGTGQLWNAWTGEPVHGPFRHQGVLDHAAFSPNGDRIITASRDNTARVWSVKSGTSIAAPIQHNGAVRWAEFSPDGKYAVTASDDRTVKMLNSTTLTPVYPPLPMDSTTYQAMFSPDGTLLLTAGPTGIRLWDVATGKARTGLLPHPHLTRANWSPDSTRIATVSMKRSDIRIWNSSNGQQDPIEIEHPSDPVMWTEFSPDGQRLISAGIDNTVRQWNLNSGTPMGSPIRVGSRVLQARYSPDGLSIATAGMAGTSRIWESTPRVPFLGPFLSATDVKDAVLSPEGKTLAMADSDGLVHLYSLSTPKRQIITFKHSDRGTGTPQDPLKLAFSPNGARLATASFDGTARLWDTTNGENLGRAMLHDGKVLAVKFSPPGDKLLTISGNTARVWNSHTGEPLTKEIKHSQLIRHAAFNRDATQLVTASTDRTCLLYDLTSDSQIGSPIKHPLHVNRAAFTPDNSHLVTACEDAKVRIWNIENEAKTEKIIPAARVRTPFELSPDGTTLVVINPDRALEFWDFESREPKGPPIVRPQGISYVKLCRNGSLALTYSGMTDRYLQLWDTQSREAIGIPIGKFSALPKITINEAMGAILVTQASGTTLYPIPLPMLQPSLQLASLTETLIERRATDSGRTIETLLYESREHLREFGFPVVPNQADPLREWMLSQSNDYNPIPAIPFSIDDYKRHLLQIGTEASLRRLLTLSPTNGIAFARLARLITTNSNEISTSDQRQIRHLLAMANHHAPAHPETLLSAAAFSFASKEFQMASDYVDLALSTAPQFQEAWILKSRVLSTMGQHQIALTAINQALELSTSGKSSNLIEATKIRHRLHLRLGQSEEAKLEFRAILDAFDVPKRAEHQTVRQLDLSPFYNIDELPTWTNIFQSGLDGTRPDREEGFDGVLFDARGTIHLFNQDTKKAIYQSYPKRIVGIPVNQSFSQLTVLHGADAERRAMNTGTVLAYYILRYHDGTRHQIPVEVGLHLRDSWHAHTNPTHAEQNKRLGAVWRSRALSPGGQFPAKRHCLFKTSWPNPFPTKTVKAIDLVSAEAAAGVFIAAITVEE